MCAGSKTGDERHVSKYSVCHVFIGQCGSTALSVFLSIGKTLFSFGLEIPGFENSSIFLPGTCFQVEIPDF